MLIQNPNNLPIDCFPLIMRNAILEGQTNTGFPIPLIAVSALGAVAAACQNSINVQLPYGTISPVSLYILSIADPGEGKSPIDGFFTKSIRDFEDDERKKFETSMPRLESSRKTWDIQRQQIESAIKKNRKKAIKNDNPEESDELNDEFEKLQQAHEDHLSRAPKLQRNYKIIHSNTTPSKLLLDLYENWPSGYLCSDEAISLFRGAAMRDLGMLAQLWDGTPQVVDRISSPSFRLKNSRLSIFLAIQGKVLQDILRGGGNVFQNSGNLARYLVVCPYTAKGTRMLSGGPQFFEYLTAYQQRILDILVQDKLEMDNGREQKHILKFSAEARKHWYDFRNNIEYNLLPGGYLSDIDDFASKITANLARIAALFHYFEGQEGDISLETVHRAGVLCDWFIHEFKRLFSSSPEVPREVADTLELEKFLVDWCSRHQGLPFVLKSLIGQYGPNRLRGSSGKGRRAYAIDQLAMQGKIGLVCQGKKSWIQLNPQYFPVSSVTQPYQLAMGY